jgi:hypothetical protein
MAAATRPRPRAAAAARWQRAERAPRQERILCEQVLLSHEHVAGLQRGPSELLDTVRMLCKQVLSNEQVGRAGGSLRASFSTRSASYASKSSSPTSMLVVLGLQRGPSELLDTVRMLCKQVLSNEQVGRAGGSLGRPARCVVECQVWGARGARFRRDVMYCMLPRRTHLSLTFRLISRLHRRDDRDPIPNSDQVHYLLTVHHLVGKLHLSERLLDRSTPNVGDARLY